MRRQALAQPQPQCVASGTAALEVYSVNTHLATHTLALVAYLAVLHLATYAALALATVRAARGGKGDRVAG